MIGGIVEIQAEGRVLTKHRGFLIISDQHREIGRVAYDDITALILSARQITLTRAVIDTLMDHKAIIVTCGADYHPIALTWPFQAHHHMAGSLQHQINASKPLKKKLWQHLIKAKITHQAQTLELKGPNPEQEQYSNPNTSDYSRGDKVIQNLLALAKGVKSGDPDNREAQAARQYWPALMGSDFRRRREGDAPNTFLNYGYAILRAATARAVCGAGLHPSLGLYHRSARNSFALIDDLMEPFRPVVDITALTLYRKLATRDHQGDQSTSLTPDDKKALAAILQQDMDTPKGVSPVANCLMLLAQSVAKSFKTGTPELDIASLKKAGHLI